MEHGRILMVVMVSKAQSHLTQGTLNAIMAPVHKKNTMFDVECASDFCLGKHLKSQEMATHSHCLHQHVYHMLGAQRH